MMHTVYIFHLAGKQMSNAFAPAAVDYAEGRLLQFSQRELSKISFHFFFCGLPLQPAIHSAP